MDQLNLLDQVSIKQGIEIWEVATDFDTLNHYTVLGPAGENLLMVMESRTKGSLFFRFLLKSTRPFEMQIMSSQQEHILTLKRSFRFYFHYMEIMTAAGELIGYIQKQFSVLKRVYSVFDSNHQEIYTISGPIWRPWTFEIYQGNVEAGVISKKWSGLLKETFTNSDNFGIQFPSQATFEQKKILLGCVFLIDFVHFET